jgi:hypothetical protein
MSTIALGLQQLFVAPAGMIWSAQSGLPDSSYYFDTVISEVHEKHAIVTEHPVEDGVNVSDHVRPMVDHVSLEVFVSNEPMGNVYNNTTIRQSVTLDLPDDSDAPLTINGLISRAVGNVLPTSVNALLDVPSPGGVDYVAQAYQLFDSLRTTATLVQLVLSRVTYQNMLLQNITMHRDQGVGTGAHVTLEYRQIRIVQSSVTNAPVPVAPQHAPQQQQGNQQTLPPKESDAVALGKWLGMYQ